MHFHPVYSNYRIPIEQENWNKFIAMLKREEEIDPFDSDTQKLNEEIESVVKGAFDLEYSSSFGYMWVKIDKEYDYLSTHEKIKAVIQKHLEMK